MFEIGCGSGSFLNFLQRSGYSQASGMDQDAQHIQTATRMGVTGASCGDAIAHLQTCQGVYDVIIAIDVVEHWTKTEIFGYLDVIYSALKPGGIFLWRSPNADGPFAGRLRYGDLTHEISFTKSSAWQLMKVAGFSEVLIRPEEPVATGVRSILRLILWQFFKAAAKLYLFAESYAHEDCLLTANLIVQAKKPKTS
jgi:2-polyprenyl-3-methyl-5-hydroxy-6-metoxy-1,4-benzoquinol methylase